MPAVKNKNKLVKNRKKRVSQPKKFQVNLVALSIMVGVILVGLGFARQFFYERSLIPLATTAITQGTASVSAIPKRMVIGDKVDVPLDKAALIENKWTVSSVNGTYLINSARLGEVGNMIIYGHNRRRILGRLGQVKVGDRIVLYDDTGKIWPYRVVKTLIINPAEAFWLQNTDTPVLTIYTCTGLLDSKRLIVRAVPVKGD